jgi:hypothetical protein
LAKNYLVTQVASTEQISVTVADFNGEGNIYLAIAFDDGVDSHVSILFGYGNGTFTNT